MRYSLGVGSASVGRWRPMTWYSVNRVLIFCCWSSKIQIRMSYFEGVSSVRRSQAAGSALKGSENQGGSSTVRERRENKSETGSQQSRMHREVTPRPGHPRIVQVPDRSYGVDKPPTTPAEHRNGWIRTQNRREIVFERLSAKSRVPTFGSGSIQGPVDGDEEMHEIRGLLVS